MQENLMGLDFYMAALINKDNHSCSETSRRIEGTSIQPLHILFSLQINMGLKGHKNIIKTTPDNIVGPQGGCWWEVFYF